MITKTNLKKVASLILLLLCITLLSCRQNSIELKEENSIKEKNTETSTLAQKMLLQTLDISEINQVSFLQLSSFTVDHQSFLFNLLNDDAKVRIWREKIQSIEEITKEMNKKNQLNKLKSLITPLVFPDSKINNFARPIEIWIEESKNILGLKNIMIILKSLNLLKIDLESGDYIEIQGNATFRKWPCPPHCG